MLSETSDTASGDVRPSLDVLGGGVSRPDADHEHTHGLDDPHHHHPHDHRAFEHHVNDAHVHVEAVAPTTPSRAVVINVGEHTGALVLASTASRSGIEVEIHPVTEPTARTHVWVLPREAPVGVVYAAVFPSLASGDYAILGLDGSIAEVISVPPNQVTHATWL
jgi:ABC-type Zn2+ transport system substrate-binding protein/surface adhesin